MLLSLPLHSSSLSLPLSLHSQVVRIYNNNQMYRGILAVVHSWWDRGQGGELGAPVCASALHDNTTAAATVLDWWEAQLWVPEAGSTGLSIVQAHALSTSHTHCFPVIQMLSVPCAQATRKDTGTKTRPLSSKDQGSGGEDWTCSPEHSRAECETTTASLCSLRVPWGFAPLFISMLYVNVRERKPTPRC